MTFFRQNRDRGPQPAGGHPPRAGSPTTTIPFPGDALLSLLLTGLLSWGIFRETFKHISFLLMTILLIPPGMAIHRLINRHRSPLAQRMMAVAFRGWFMGCVGGCIAWAIAEIIGPETVVRGRIVGVILGGLIGGIWGWISRFPAEPARFLNVPSADDSLRDGERGESSTDPVVIDDHFAIPLTLLAISTGWLTYLNFDTFFSVLFSIPVAAFGWLLSSSVERVAGRRGLAIVARGWVAALCGGCVASAIDVATGHDAIRWGSIVLGGAIVGAFVGVGTLASTRLRDPRDEVFVEPS